MSTNELLVGKDGTGAAVCFDTVPWLGLWSKPKHGLSHICVEPWFGVDDTADADGELAHKMGIQSLAEGGEFVFNMSIRLF